jgi:hypothetical protein
MLVITGRPLDQGIQPMKFTDLKTNPAAANEGRWQKDIPGMGNIELFVRSTNNPEYRRRMQAMARALPPSKKKGGSIDPVEMDRINGVCLLDHSLSDWKNVEGENGEAVPYSYDQAKVFLTLPEWSFFRDGVFVAASTVEEEDREADAATEKNSAAPSAIA